MRDGEEQGSGGSREAQREGAVPSESGGVPREREEGRAATEEDPLTRDWVEVPLTRGMVAKIDRQDMLVVGRYSWCAMPAGGLWYAGHGVKRDGKKTTEYMHRRIMEPPDGMMVDHINHDGLDNRRANLRICTRSQNGANRKSRAANAKCEYSGVWKDPRRENGKWSYRITVNGDMVSKSGFPSAQDAARARDAVLVDLFGSFAVKSFPDGK